MQPQYYQGHSVRMPVYVYRFWPRRHQEARLQQRELVLTSEAGDCRLEFGWLLFQYYLISILSLWLFLLFWNCTEPEMLAASYPITPHISGQNGSLRVGTKAVFC